MEILMKGNGKIIKLMVLVYISIILEQYMKAIGKRICRVELVFKYGLMGVDIKVPI